MREQSWGTSAARTLSAYCCIREFQSELKFKHGDSPTKQERHLRHHLYPVIFLTHFALFPCRHRWVCCSTIYWLQTVFVLPFPSTSLLINFLFSRLGVWTRHTFYIEISTKYPSTVDRMDSKWAVSQDTWNPGCGVSDKYVSNRSFQAIFGYVPLSVIVKSFCIKWLESAKCWISVSPILSQLKWHLWLNLLSGRHSNSSQKSSSENLKSRGSPIRHALKSSMKSRPSMSSRKLKSLAKPSNLGQVRVGSATQRTRLLKVLCDYQA